MDAVKELTEELEKRGYFNFEILQAEKVSDSIYNAKMVIRENTVDNQVKLNLTDAEFKGIN